MLNNYYFCLSLSRYLTWLEEEDLIKLFYSYDIIIPFRTIFHFIEYFKQKRRNCNMVGNDLNLNDRISWMNGLPPPFLLARSTLLANGSCTNSHFKVFISRNYYWIESFYFLILCLWIAFRAVLQHWVHFGITWCRENGSSLAGNLAWYPLCMWDSPLRRRMHAYHWQ